MGPMGRSADLHVGSADPTSGSIRRGSLSFVLDSGLEPSGISFMSNGLDFMSNGLAFLDKSSCIHIIMKTHGNT